jgi:hypothetical protein
MGNHTIDCKFCGEDQRFGPCCDEYAEHEKKRKEEREKKEDVLRRYLLKFGLLSYGYSGTVSSKDVMELLQRFEGKILEPLHEVFDNTCQYCHHNFIDTKKSDNCGRCSDW